jgi:hypothetical protein
VTVGCGDGDIVGDGRTTVVVEVIVPLGKLHAEITWRIAIQMRLTFNKNDR